jgi:hypothetical protein
MKYTIKILSDKLLAPWLTSKQKEHSLSTDNGRLFNMAMATLHIW